MPKRLLASSGGASSVLMSYNFVMEELVCVQCGVRGWPETLVCCYMCRDAFEHRYCFEKASNIFKEDVKWACQDCLPTVPKKTKIKENNVITPTRRSERIFLKHDLDADTSPSSGAAKKHSSLESDKKRGNKRKVCAVSQKEKPLETPTDVFDGDHEQNDCSTPIEENHTTKKTTKSFAEAAELSMDLPMQETGNDDMPIDPLQKSNVQAQGLVSSFSREAEKVSAVNIEKKKKMRKVCAMSQKEKPLETPTDVFDGDHEQNDCSTAIEENHPTKKTKKSFSEAAELSMDLPIQETGNDDMSNDQLQKSNVQAQCLISSCSREAENVSAVTTGKKKKKKGKKCKANQKKKPLESSLDVCLSDLVQKDRSMSEKEQHPTEQRPTEKTKKSLSGAELLIDLPVQENVNGDLFTHSHPNSYVQGQPIASPSSRAAEKDSPMASKKKRKRKRKVCKVSLREKSLGLPPKVSHGDHKQKDCSTSEVEDDSSLEIDTKRKKRREVCELSQKEEPLGSPAKVSNGDLEHRSTSEAVNLPTGKMKKSLLEVKLSDDIPVHETENDELSIDPLQRSYVQVRAAGKVSPAEANKKKKSKLRRCKAGQKKKPVESLSGLCQGELEQNDCSTLMEEKLPSEKPIECLSVVESTIAHPMQETTDDDVSIIVDPIRVEVPCGHAQSIADLVEEQKSYAESQRIAHPMEEQTINFLAQPVAHPVWIGTFSIINERFTKVDGVVAHLSNSACLRVREEASLLPFFLYPDILPRSNIWPKTFQKGELNEDCIALYFIPENRDEQVFSSLVNHMIKGDFGMMCTVENAELLVFTSVLLPLELRDFDADDFLWGVFRAKKGGSTSRS